MNEYRNYDIDELLRANPLEAWVRGDVNNITRIGGGKFMAEAPWRADSTPSVLVTPNTGASGTFYDFGARTYTGSTINWIMFTRNLNKGEAIRMLGDRSPIPLSKARETTVIEGSRDKRKANLSMQMVNDYHKHLALAMPYFAGRGITEDVAKRAKLGYEAKHEVYVKIMDNQWLGSPFMTVPCYVIPNFIGFDGGKQVVRGIHLRYDNVVAREKVHDMWKLGSPNAIALVNWLNIVDKDPVDVIHDYLFGQRYKNKAGSRQMLFNPNRLLAVESDRQVIGHLPNLIIGEGPLAIYPAESLGFPSVGLPNNKTSVNAKEAFANIDGKIFLITDDDQAGHDRAKHVMEQCGADRCVRINPGKKQLDGMALDGTLEAELAKWGVYPNHAVIASTPF